MQAEAIRFLSNEVRKETDHTRRGPGGQAPPPGRVKGRQPLPPEASSLPRPRLRKGPGGRTSEPCNTKQYSLIWTGR